MLMFCYAGMHETHNCLCHLPSAGSFFVWFSALLVVKPTTNSRRETTASARLQQAW